MPKRQAGDAILDLIANDLGAIVSKRKTTSNSKVRCPAGEAPTASLAGPTGEHPTGVVTDHDAGTDNNTQSTVINPTGGRPVPVASTSAQSDTRQLQSTVEALANQMAWFVETMMVAIATTC